MKSRQLFRVFITIAWLLSSIVAGVACVKVGHFVFHLLAMGFAFCTAVAGYVLREEWRLL